MVLNGGHDSDESENEEQYAKLANDVSQLDDKRRVRAPIRKELSSVISEYHLPKDTSRTGDLVSLNELAGVLGGKVAHTKIGNKVKKIVKESKTLQKPLEKPVAERIKRIVGYLNVKEQLKKWNAVVERNRAAEHLNFPLQGGRFKLVGSKEFLNRFKTRTPLETEMYKILGEPNEEEKTAEENEENGKLEFPLTLEEMLEKKRELAHIRAKLSYQEAKAYRQSKIKSKKYHRILKREKVKQQLKEFEQLVKTDPEAALNKLEALDKNRAQERASLRHKNTGKWAKNLAVRAKYDKDSRKVLAEQLKLSRDLTEKVKNRMNSDEDESDNENASEAVHNEMFVASKDNPWALNVSSEVSDFVSSCKKYWKNQEKNGQLTSKKNNSLGSDKKQTVTPTEDLVEDNSDGAGDTEVNCLNENLEQNPIEVSTDLASSSGKKKKLKKKDKSSGSVIRKSKLSEVTVTESPKNSKESINTSQSKSIVKLNGNKVNKDETSRRKSRKKSKSESQDLVKKSGQKDAQSTSGAWEVSEIDENHKRKAPIDIDDIFDDLDEKLTNKTNQKLKKMKKGLGKKGKMEKVQRGNDPHDDLALRKNPAHLRPDLDEELGETTGVTSVSNPVESGNKPQLEIPANESQPEIDPNTFINVTPKKLNTKLPDDVTDECYMDDEENSKKMDIVEAFVDDDVMEEFEEMKKEEEESSKPEISNALPGWGSWGGAEIKPSERKTKRNLISVPKPQPKKNETKKDIIIREKANQKIIDHMVKDIPHPFTSVGAFEANIREPVGREWIPETAHRKFIKAPVETQMGVIIDPMDENELVRLAKDRKSLYRGKKKNMKK